MPSMELFEIPRAWEGETVVCVATGPSLKQEEIMLCKQAGYKMIAINDAYRVAPADILYACDWWWWNDKNFVPEFSGLKIALGYDSLQQSPIAGWGEKSERDKINLLGSSGYEGLETENPCYIRGGGNSGYQAINLAVHLGAKVILLLGYDMKKGKDGKTHFFGEHIGHTNPSEENFKQFRKNFKSLVKPLEEIGVKVFNCNPDSAIKFFPKRNLEEII